MPHCGIQLAFFACSSLRQWRLLPGALTAALHADRSAATTELLLRRFLVCVIGPLH
jgi:hypothetical protein